MAIVIAIANRKGGGGKTTTSKNLSYNLEMYFNERTLLIDLDPQCNATKGLSNRNYKKTVIDLLQNKPIKKCIFKTRFKIDILPGNDYLASEEIEIGILRKQLKEIDDEYDYIIIDTSPYYNKLTAEILMASNLVIIPTDIETDSLDGVNTTIRELRSLCGEDINYKLLYTKVDDLISTKKDIEELDTVFKDHRFNTMIRYNHSAIKKARLYQQPLAIRYKGSKATSDYIELANELIGGNK